MGVPLMPRFDVAHRGGNTPGVAQVRYDPYYDRCDFGPFQNWSCNNNPLFG
jgi:hypothetical protein